MGSSTALSAGGSSGNGAAVEDVSSGVGGPATGTAVRALLNGLGTPG